MQILTMHISNKTRIHVYWGDLPRNTRCVGSVVGRSPQRVHLKPCLNVYKILLKSGNDGVATATSTVENPVDDVKKRLEGLTSTAPAELEQTLENLELPSFKEKWGIFTVYVLWILLVSLQLFRKELYGIGVPDAVIDVAVSGTTATLALTWDQLVAGPRRNKMAKMEAAINAKLDLQEQLSKRRYDVEAEIQAKLELNERLQMERAKVEEQISAKLDAELQSFLKLQQILQAPSHTSIQSEAAISHRIMQSLSSMDEDLPATSSSQSSSSASSLLDLVNTSQQAQQARPLESTTAPAAAPINLEVGITASDPRDVSALAGMQAQLSHATLQPSTDDSEPGALLLNIKIKLLPVGKT
ncbi:hypothetical protein CEUSTIGMA_g10882.t1 [Chlamydomonas eustigma]|uniref:Uncharacterized protein n=1 Tax=Chlamydomonas eustigma TaxID=1157962 RepID=A0A250XK68_9CHLO|nr:hypothetical protein CEUSTIGMA_g10882.t1 [Chlamydomonas eustigma]|eukprot:GAX83457.1 hypothetical protein CEUSTIGMA_g10882.t1 [Chlamydomonas eustigma]